MNDSANTREAADRLQEQATGLREHAKTQNEASKNLESAMRSAGGELARHADALRAAAAKFLAVLRQG